MWVHEDALDLSRARTLCKISKFTHNFISKLKAGLEIEFRKVLKKRHAHYIVATITAIIALTFATVEP